LCGKGFAEGTPFLLHALGSYHVHETMFLLRTGMPRNVTLLGRADAREVWLQLH